MCGSTAYSKSILILWTTSGCVCAVCWVQASAACVLGASICCVCAVCWVQASAARVLIAVLGAVAAYDLCVVRYLGAVLCVFELSGYCAVCCCYFVVVPSVVYLSLILWL